ncbi:DUF6497 family protein [Szabonella alba]|uniref:Acetolactate synthase n=1 Tax=Szabonella alba TaxID=2804194 RepID=A0A8K0VB20_9RHOB|nr:DUF6497 family protein [Szabonella alba]MBL4915972.1 acetolactate synthase [Szabonella alba]
MTGEAAKPAIEGDAPILLPSGQQVTFLDAIWNEPGPGGLTTRFRFLAPDIGTGGTVGFDLAVEDMAYLCESYALPRVADNIPPPQQIIITLFDRPVAFGEAAPEATQYFEAYRIEDGLCIWEIY